jgi:copper oxidase (laccase) domain-containing protein
MIVADIIEHQSGIKSYQDRAVVVAYSGTEAGNMSKRFGHVEEVLANRAKLRQVVGAGQYIMLSVEQEARIVDLGNANHLDTTLYKADGFFTTRTDLVLGLNAADCIGMVIYGEHVVGLIHIGRKGAVKGIHRKALQHIVEHYGTVPENVRIFLAPSIQQESYYFDQLPAEMQTEDWQNFIHDNHVDLVGRVTTDLLQSGLRPEQIVEDATDVGAEDTPYFSHSLQSKHQGPPGRNGIMVRLLPSA